MARSWERFGRFLKVLGRHIRACNMSLKRFAELLGNLQKHCKVLQKSRFGGSEKEEQNQLGKQLGTNSDAKLARETEVWSQDDRVDAIWRAKRHQVRAQRRSWGPQVGAKGAQKGHGHH